MDRWIDGFFLAIAVVLILLRSWDTLAVEPVLLIIGVCLGVVGLRWLLRRTCIPVAAQTVLSVLLAVAGGFLLKGLMSI